MRYNLKIPGFVICQRIGGQAIQKARSLDVFRGFYNFWQQRFPTITNLGAPE